jgi:formylglycine-generating enzyme required for sulfatase activity
MGNNPSYFKNCGDKCPVEGVSWFDVRDFIKRLNEKESTNKYRLPTEAEWEYACRAGSQSAYCFGDDPTSLDEFAWYEKDRTNPVGQMRPNSWGLYDMHGNVSEWCSDWFDKDYYSRSPSKDAWGPESGTARVIRGGFWGCKPEWTRCAYREFVGKLPSVRADYIGFRLVRIP